VLVFSLAGFVLWSILVFHSHVLVPLDEYVNQLASKGASCPLWGSINEYLSSLGYGTFIYVICAVLIGYLVLQGRIREALWVIAALVIGLKLNNALKIWFSRPRPPALLADYMLRSSAYPSGHAFCGLFFYGIALWILRQMHIRLLRMRWAKWLIVIMVLLIGGSRIALGVHWVSDIIAGYLAGLVWLTSNIVLAERLQFFDPKNAVDAVARRRKP